MSYDDYRNPHQGEPPESDPGWQSGYPPQPEQSQPSYPQAEPRAPQDRLPDQRRGPGWIAVILISALAAVIVSGTVGVAGGYLGASLAPTRSNMTTNTPAKVSIVPAATSEPVVAAASAAVPSIVNIDVQAGTTKGGGSGLPGNHPTVPMIGNGSGVAYKQDGRGGTYIITNNHVVKGAKKLTVKDVDGNSVSAKIIGRDAETDIAVVRVPIKLPVIQVADSSKLLVGQTVVAIGSPFGLEHSVTSGVVSAMGRSLPDFAAAAKDAYPLVDVIQTDAAINPGNSGGALVDRKGRLIGINTAIYSDTGASGGVGFAIPVNSATRVANELIRGEAITHPFIGIIGQSVTADFAKQERLSVSQGAFVSSLTPGSGAQKAGVKTGDVVTMVNGVAVRSMDDLILQVRRKQTGQLVTLTIVRDRKTMAVKVKVGNKPANLKVPGSKTPSAP